MKRKFREKILDVQKQVMDFRSKDRISEAENYAAQLEDINKKLEELNTEVYLGSFKQTLSSFACSKIIRANSALRITAVFCTFIIT